MKTGVVDHHKGIGPLLLKETIGHAKKPPEARQVGDDGCYTHDGEIAKWVEEPAAGGSHAIPAESVDVEVWLTPTKGVDEIGAVKIAAGFARADEQTHKEHPCHWRKSKRPSWPPNVAEDYQGKDDGDKAACGVLALMRIVETPAASQGSRFVQASCMLTIR
jgi:hypothetical protein